MKRIKFLAILLSLVIVLSFTTVTLLSYYHEPKKPEIFNLRKAADGYDPYVSPNLTRTFNMFGGNATFVIQFVGAEPVIGNVGIGIQNYLQWINIIKIKQSTIFKMGRFSLLVDSVNETVSEGGKVIGYSFSGDFPIKGSTLFNVSGLGIVGSIGNTYPYLNITNKYNQNVQSSFICFVTTKLQMVYALNGYINASDWNPVDEEGNLTLVSEFNYTYSIEVTPLLELGPYYEEGNPVWITQAFQYPYHGETQAFGNMSGS